MAKVKIQGSASGSGVLTIQAPTTSTDRTITLPDTTGTLLDENSSVPAANLTGTVADARISALTASKLTGALPAISGSSLTGIDTDKSIAIYTYKQNVGTAGGTNGSGSSWHTYPFNTESFDPDGIGALSSNQVTLQAGKYLITWGIDAYRWGEHNTYIENVTDGTELGRGNNGRAGGSDYTTAHLAGSAYLDCSSAKAIALKYNAGASQTSYGLGVERNNGADEVYGVLTVLKVG